jgi:hypothetical protein
MLPQDIASTRGNPRALARIFWIPSNVNAPCAKANRIVKNATVQADASDATVQEHVNIAEKAL